MKITVFYSWQSDLPNATNWTFIQTALERACKSLRTSNEATVEPVVDRDTSNVPGAPDIAHTILAKINTAAILVADVSIITPPEAPRPAPNPNVLVELGYGMKAVGERRVIQVMNTAYGGPELLPFDLRSRKTIKYTARVSDSERATERKKLESMFRSEIESMLAEITSDLATHSARQIKLALLDASSKPVSNIAISQRSYSLIKHPPASGGKFAEQMRRGEAIKAFVANVNRTYWLQLRVRNAGRRPARNIVVDFDIGGADEVALIPDRPPWLTSLAVAGPSRAHDPNQHVYVDGCEARSGVIHLRQRIRDIGAEREEPLVRMGLRATSLHEKEMHLDVRYSVIAEDGERTDGHFAIAVGTLDTENVEFTMMEGIANGRYNDSSSKHAQ